MGIRGLKQWLQIQSSPVTPDWTCFEQTTIGIDLLPFLYNAKKKSKCIITRVAEIVDMLRSKQIEPIVFFDGKPPSEKKDVVKERSDGRKQIEVLTQELETGPDRITVEEELKRLQAIHPTVSYIERDLVKKFLYTMGVRYVNATGEADSILAYWSKTNVLSAVISTDMDMLPRGINHLIMPNERDEWVEYTLPTILRDISLTLEQFQTMCVLMGTDYTKNIRPMHVRTAYILVRNPIHSLRDIWKGADLPLLERAKTLLEGTEDTLQSLLNEKERIRWLADSPPIEPEGFEVFQHTYFPSTRMLYLQRPVREAITGLT
jgi:5'-3' exonuclease